MTRQPPGPRLRLIDLSLVVQVHAACAASGIDPDAWFPVSRNPESARREAADALAVCWTCPVRALCLELSFQQWTIGQHGIWGGTLPGERKKLHDQLAVLPPALSAGSTEK